MIWLTLPAFVKHKRNLVVKSQPGLTDKERDLLTRVNGCISRADTMYEGDVANYFLVGLSGLRAVESVLKNSHPNVINKILDLPCGCGRVGRYLATRFPEAEITACDLMTDGVDFCARKLGMRPVYSKPDFETLDLGQKYDLIWCGSLVTHLRGNAISSLLRCLHRHLSDNGVLVFTTHGDFVAKQLGAGHDYGIGDDAARQSVELYKAQGIVFMPYLGQSDAYGFSITSAAWIRSHCVAINGWEEVFFQPQGWDHHQDVYGLQKCGSRKA
jgi:SAM-dependent methyltransferase